MDSTSKVLLLVGLLVAAVLYVVIAVKVYRRRETRRQSALARVAAELEMEFTPEDHGLLRQFAGIAFSLPEAVTRATSVMRGAFRGAPVVLLDYHAIFKIGNSSSTMELTVAGFDLTSRSLPVFDADGSPDWSTRLFNKSVGEKAIVFNDDSDFTRYFNVTSDDELAVRQIFGPAVRSFLTLNRRGWIIRSNGRWLAMYQSHKRIAPEGYRTFLKEASEVMLVITEAWL